MSFIDDAKPQSEDLERANELIRLIERYPNQPTEDRRLSFATHLALWRSEDKHMIERLSGLYNQEMREHSGTRLKLTGVRADLERRERDLDALSTRFDKLIREGESAR